MCAISASWRISTPARPPLPSGCCTTPESTTRSAKYMKAPPRWTGWCRSRNAASRSLRRRPPASGATIGSTSSTRPDTSTSPSRSSEPSRARRRGGRVLRGRRRRAAIRDRVASGRQISRPAHRVRQQDGPRGRRLRARGRRNPRQAQGQAAGASASDRLRGKVHRRNRPGRESRARVGRGSFGRELPGRGDSGRSQGKRARLAREDDRDACRPRRAHHGDVPRRQGRAVAGAAAQGRSASPRSISRRYRC